MMRNRKVQGCRPCTFFLDIVCDTQYYIYNTNVPRLIRRIVGGEGMNCDEIVSGLILELRRGTLILLVLNQLQKPMYGYNLVKELQEHGIPMEANTLYPLMRRLESQGLLKSEWETGEAKPRKYYSITEDGRAVLQKAKANWFAFSVNVNQLLEDDAP